MSNYPKRPIRQHCLFLFIYFGSKVGVAWGQLLSNKFEMKRKKTCKVKVV